MTAEPEVLDPSAAGWQAIAAGDWPAAKRLFETAIEADETAEALEGLGWAAYFLDDAELTFAARERAFRRFRERDDPAAARVAGWIATDCYEFRGEPAVANGWLQRAHRFLEGREPGPANGWLAVHEAQFRIERDPEAARAMGREAVELGRRFDDIELELIGLAVEGLALVSGGDLEGGMRRLDEASAAAIGGEGEFLTSMVWAGCSLITACEQVGDYDRATQWCERIGAVCERYQIGLGIGICRAKYANVLAWQGRWVEAEDALVSAADTLASSRPGLVGEALARLAELRWRQGRLDEAAELLARCEPNSIALLTRAEMALDRGDVVEAADVTDRFLRRYEAPHRMKRGAGLALAIRAHTRLGDLQRAHELLTDLRGIAARAGTTPLQASVLASEGTLAAAAGDHDAARRSFEDAVDTLVAAPAPFEAARVRLELAATLRALGRPEAARRELHAALTGFEALGAADQSARARAMLAEVDARPAQPTPHGTSTRPLDGLTTRQLEVLALVARGLSNADIADRLVISEHTVHRHVANILRILNLPSRTAAASLAGRHGLV